MRVVWDEKKNLENIRKHKLSFEEAKTVFSAPPWQADSRSRSFRRRRLVCHLGLSKMPRLLVVCHCCRENDETIRLITARKATRKEAGFLWRANNMRKEYDFTNARPNPYAKNCGNRYQHASILTQSPISKRGRRKPAFLTKN